MYERKVKIISGISVDAIGTMFSIIISLIIVPFFFIYITKEQYGLWLAIYGLIAMISVVDMGTDQYLTTIISNDDKFYSGEVSHYLLSTLIIKFVVVSIFAIVGIISYTFISNLLVIDSASLEVAKRTYLIGLIALVFNLFSATVSTILYGRHHYSLVNGLASLSSVLASFGTILFLDLGFNISAFPLAQLSAALLQFAIMFGFMVTRYPHINLNLTDFKFQNKNELISYSVSFQILRWLHTLRTQYIVIAINNLVGPGAAATFNLTNRLPQLITVFASKIAMPFFPSFSEYFSNRKIESAAIAFIKVNKVLFRFSLFAAIVCFVVSRSFVSLWVGMDNFAGIDVLFLLCAYVFILAAMGSFGIIIYSSKKFEKWTWVSIIEIIFAVILSYILSHNFGLIGVISGFVLASLISQIYLFTIVLKQIKIKIINFVKEVLLYAIYSNISTLIVALFVFLAVEISGWYEMILVCVFFAVAHVISYEGLFVFQSKEIGIKAKIISAIKL